MPSDVVAKVPRLLGFSAALAGAALAADPSPQAADPRSGNVTFSLLPKALERNPRVSMTVISEMTPLGRRIAQATAEKPIYYLAQVTGYHDEGQGVTGERPVPVLQLQKRIEASLATAHYLPASAGRAPTLVLVFVWGSHNALDKDTTTQQLGFENSIAGQRSGFVPATDFYETAENRDVGYRNLLSRAALVGGVKFAQELAVVIRDQERHLEANNRMGVFPSGGSSPLEIFTARDAKTRDLMERAEGDCYYVVASAYEGSALAHGQRKLLWRTKMTTNSQGLSMEQSLPTLISAGGPYFGKDMSEAATVESTGVSEGRVEVGTPVQVNALEKAR